MQTAKSGAARIATAPGQQQPQPPEEVRRGRFIALAGAIGPLLLCGGRRLKRKSDRDVICESGETGASRRSWSPAVQYASDLVADLRARQLPLDSAHQQLVVARVLVPDRGCDRQLERGRFKRPARG